MKDLFLYFDYAATTPCAPEVTEAIYACLSSDKLYGNASSAHGLAHNADNAIEQTRLITGQLINCEQNEIIFTSGATESNNLAILGLSDHLKSIGKPHIISSSTEHKAVLDTLKFLEVNGHKVTLLDPDTNGIISTTKLQKTIQSDTGLLSIMHVNNETGVIQDIARIGEIARKHNILLHVDAAQSAGKLPIDVDSMNIDLLSICAHKFYGPKGSGALYVKKDLRSKISPLFHGGGQEGKARPGTYANHQIVGLGKTIEIALDKMESDISHAHSIRKLLITELREVISQINGAKAETLPSILNVSFKGIDATTLLTTLQGKIALATGSACNSGTVAPSHVLMAMGLSGEVLDNSIRISFGRYTTEQEALKACELINAEIKRIKSYL